MQKNCHISGRALMGKGGKAKHTAKEIHQEEYMWD